MRWRGPISTRRSFLIWGGVTNYLTAEAVDATLRFVSETAAGSQWVFTYVCQGVLDNPADFEGTRNLMRLLQQQPEPRTFGPYPAELPSYLESRGLQLLEAIGSVDYRARYRESHGRHVKGYEFYRIAVARVVKPLMDVII